MTTTRKAVVAAAFSGVLLWAAANKAGTEKFFEDVTGKAGIQFRHVNREFKNPYAHIMAGYTSLGASVAIADFDGDGWEDFFLTTSDEKGKNKLYRNNGNFTFTDVAEMAGVANGNDAANAGADAIWFDYNGDGRPDLFLVRFGQSLLYENLGGGKFRDVTMKAGLKLYANSIAASAFDYDGDGDVDLFAGNYFKPVNIFNPDTPRFFPESFETAANGGGMTAWRNNGNGTFTDVTKLLMMDKVTGWTLDLGHADVDNDGDEDLYVAADFGTDTLYRNNADGTFTDITADAMGIDTKKGMNVDWGDFDGDGLIDAYVTNITDEYMREGNFLWRNITEKGADGKPAIKFIDVASETGTRDTGWGWGGKFFDYDNDGHLDLYVVNGWVSNGEATYVKDIFEMITKPNIDLADARNWPPMGSKSLSGYQKKRLFHNEADGTFKDHAPRHGLDNVKDGRGIGIADFDHDGRLDMIVANANSAPFFYRNSSPERRWVSFVLDGVESNRLATGAQVRVTAGGHTQLGMISGGNSFAGQSSGRVHFGLGDAAKIDRVEVRWPCGTVQTVGGIESNKMYRVVEGKAKAELFSPKAK